MRTGNWDSAGRSRALKRGVDIVEARLLVLLCAVVVGCASVFGVIDAMAALHHEQSVVEQQRATRHAVRAEILRDAAKSSPWTDESGRSELVPVPVRWTGTGGAAVTADAQVVPGAKRGERVDVWLDRTGRVTSAPSDGQDVYAAALVGGLGSAAVAVGAGAVAGIGIRIVCNRRRAAGWEAEWSRVEPEWSRRP
ncbi:hypothetical protein [Streptomyces sp. JH34]|uniref:Rv1733c family protein n=1 Tax=Streptomyces sp. JH34 TaxID=2793633 RepID=UPI0023F827F4|nr:hypothetical protein [Streptomyces sp. JH34]MDF6022464.1 hypothetical protein [Streptomyces sp. JH34]